MALAIRGELPPYVIKRLKVDKIGVFSGLVERQFIVGDVNQRIDPLWLVQAPNPWGIPFVDAEATITAPTCTISYSYEGAPSDYTFGDDAVTFELDASMSEDRIETHPAFKLLKQQYGWNQDERAFNEFLAEVPKTQGALPGTTEKGKPNPLFGLDSYFAVGVVYRKTYAARSLPDGLLKGIGTIVDRPPDIGQFRIPKSIGKRNWLKMAPRISKRGGVIQISEEWMLSAPGGWRKPVYDSGQLEK